MKKVAAAIIFTLLALCACALAEEPFETAVYEDGGVYEFTFPISENAEGAEYLYKTEFGLLSLSADGRYVYTCDPSREFAAGAEDVFMISYVSLEGDTYTREIIVKAGQNAEGSAVSEGPVTENASFATKHSYIRVENGYCTVTVKNWAVQYLSEGERLEEQFAVIENGAREVAFNVIIIGRNDVPTARDSVGEFVVGVDDTISGGVKFGGGDGEISVTCEKAKHGKLKLNADGTYTYKADEADPEIAALRRGDILKDEIKFTARDKDGDYATGKITITLKSENSAPAFPEFSVTTSEGGGPITINFADYPHTLGDGGAAAHEFTWQNGTSIYGNLTQTGDWEVMFTPDADALTSLGETDTLELYYYFTFADADGDSVSSRLKIIVKGKDSAPEAHGAGITVSEFNAAPIVVKPEDYMTKYGDGRPSAHIFAVDFGALPAYVKAHADDGKGTFSITLDTDDPMLYNMKNSDKKTLTVLVTVKDADGDPTDALVTINITGVDRNPAISDITFSIDEDDSPMQFDLKSRVSLGDGPLSAHKVTVYKRPDNEVGTLRFDPIAQALLYAPDSANPAVYGLSDGESLTQEYKLILEDGDGHKVVFGFKATINGVNRVPKAQNVPIQLDECENESKSGSVYDGYVKLGEGPMSKHKVTWGGATM